MPRLRPRRSRPGRLLSSPPPPLADLEAHVLARGPGGALSRFAIRLLRMFGWRVVLRRPLPPKSVVVFYPHTSNWDFAIGLLAKWGTGIFFRFVGKHTLFDTPFGPLFRRWGGIPVNRRDPAGFITTLQRAFDEHASFHIAIAPEGTRSRTEHWKSGFHRLAVGVGVPVGLAFIDRPRKLIGIGDWIGMTGDADADLERIRAFYADKVGWQPARAGPIRFRDQRESRPL